MTTVQTQIPDQLSEIVNVVVASTVKSHSGSCS